MNISFPFRWLAFVLFLVGVAGADAIGQISIGALPYSYSNNLDAYVSLATLPNGWTKGGTGGFVGASNGSLSNGGFYSYGATSDPDRSLGALHSSSATGSYTVTFTNNSGSTITSLTLAWNYEQWRFAQNNSGWDCSGTGALAGNAILGGKDFAGAGTGPSGGGAGPVAVTPVTSFTLTGLSIANGTSFGVTWIVNDASGADNGISIDDFSMSATAAPAATAPTVLTTRATAIASNGITSGGNVTADGGATLTAKGVAWGATTNPTSGTATSGTAIGAYTTAISGLSPNTNYYYRAYATNSAGTSYGVNYDTVTRAAVPDLLADNSTTNAQSSIDLVIGENGNPNGSPGNTTQYAIKETSTNTWLQANGTLGASEVWQSYAAWGPSATGLNANTQYCFQVKARNNNNIETALSTPSVCVTTAAATGTITGVAGTADVCNGAASSFNITYTSTVSSGTYTAQLSDASGSFASPVNIGTGTSATTIAVTLPAGQAPGSDYRIRIVNSNIISDTTSVFIIKGSPSGSLVAAPATICPGQEATAQLTFTATAGTGPFALSIKNVQASNTVNYTGIASGTAFTVDASQVPAAGNTDYQLLQITANNGCTNP